MRWWLVIIQVLILSAIALGAGLFHASVSPDFKDLREEFVPTWHRTAWNNAINRYAPKPEVSKGSSSGTAGNDSSAKNPDRDQEGADQDQAATNDSSSRDEAGEEDPQDADTSAPNNESADQDKPDVDPDAQADPEPAFDPSQLGPNIVLEEAKALYDLVEGVYFIDARLYEEYKEGHIEGALAIPLNAMREYEGIPPHQENGVIIPEMNRLVIYCRGGDCDESLLVARELRAIGFTCHIFLDGYPAWEDSGYPTSSGPDPWLEAFGAEPDG